VVAVLRRNSWRFSRKETIDDPREVAVFSGKITEIGER
jgi:hypothetical protein